MISSMILTLLAYLLILDQLYSKRLKMILLGVCLAPFFVAYIFQDQLLYVPQLPFSPLSSSYNP